MKRLLVSLHMGLFALALGCSSDRTGLVPSAGDENVAGQGGSASQGGWGAAGFGGQGGAAGMVVAPAFEPFEIAIDQTVTVGAFVLAIGSARISPNTSAYWSFANVEVEFFADNLSTNLEAPLSGYAFGDGMLLDVDGEYFYGEAEVDSVPGLRSGEGKMFWSVDLSEVSVDRLRMAVITLGFADQNQVVIPLGDLAATVGLNDIDLNMPFRVVGINQSTVDILSVAVQYSSHRDNELYPAGTAALVMHAELTGDPDIWRGGVYWGDENMYLVRPDGVSVAPEYLNEALFAGDRQEITLVFELEVPFVGTYTFAVHNEADGTVTREILIP